MGHEIAFQEVEIALGALPEYVAIPGSGGFEVCLRQDPFGVIDVEMLVFSLSLRTRLLASDIRCVLTVIC